MNVLILGDSLALCGFGRRLDERVRESPLTKGTYTYLARLQNGFTYAALFNRREETGSLDFNVLSPQINAEISKVTTWPTTDLFPTYF